MYPKKHCALLVSVVCVLVDGYSGRGAQAAMPITDPRMASLVVVSVDEEQGGPELVVSIDLVNQQDRSMRVEYVRQRPPFDVFCWSNDGVLQHVLKFGDSEKPEAIRGSHYWFTLEAGGRKSLIRNFVVKGLARELESEPLLVQFVFYGPGYAVQSNPIFIQAKTSYQGSYPTQSGTDTYEIIAPVVGGGLPTNLTVGPSGKILRETANENVGRLIGLVRLYKMKAGHYPKSLQDIRRDSDFLPPPSVYTSPTRDEKMTEREDGMDYEIRSIKEPKPSGRLVIVWDKPGNWPNGGFIGYYNGQVRFIETTPGEWEELVAALKSGTDKDLVRRYIPDAEFEK